MTDQRMAQNHRRDLFDLLSLGIQTTTAAVTVVSAIRVFLIGRKVRTHGEVLRRLVEYLIQAGRRTTPRTFRRPAGESAGQIGSADPDCHTGGNAHLVASESLARTCDTTPDFTRLGSEQPLTIE